MAENAKNLFKNKEQQWSNNSHTQLTYCNWRVNLSSIFLGVICNIHDRGGHDRGGHDRGSAFMVVCLTAGVVFSFWYSASLY